MNRGEIKKSSMIFFRKMVKHFKRDKARPTDRMKTRRLTARFMVEKGPVSPRV